MGPVHLPDAEIHVWARRAACSVVPKAAKNKELAYEFIDIVISKENQTDQANAGGVALAADSAAVTDPVGKQVSTMFAEIAGKGGLGFYPDWPVPGYYDDAGTDVTPA